LHRINFVYDLGLHNLAWAVGSLQQGRHFLPQGLETGPVEAETGTEVAENDAFSV
jgi:hypothetical protein